MQYFFLFLSTPSFGLWHEYSIASRHFVQIMALDSDFVKTFAWNACKFFLSPFLNDSNAHINHKRGVQFLVQCSHLVGNLAMAFGLWVILVRWLVFLLILTSTIRSMTVFFCCCHILIDFVMSIGSSLVQNWLVFSEYKH